MTARCRQGSRLLLVSTQPPRGTGVSSNSVMVVTPGTGCSITSTTTVSTSLPKDFVRCCFIRGAAFTARLGLVTAILRFVPRLGADVAASRPPAAEVLRNFARLFGRALVRFFHLAMIDPPSRSLPRSVEECMRWRRLDQIADPTL
jgi:hypothetical protein